MRLFDLIGHGGRARRPEDMVYGIREVGRKNVKITKGYM